MEISSFSTEVERKLLGTLFQNENGFKSVQKIINIGDFQAKSHNDIFEAIMGVFSKYLPIKVKTVANELKLNKTLKSSGGISYLEELVKYSTSPDKINLLSKFVKEKASLVKLITASTEILNTYYEGAILTGVLEGDFESMKSLIPKTVKQIESYSKKGSGKETRNIVSGFKNMDAKFDFKKGELIVLASRPAVGKTSLALSIVSNIVKYQKKIVGIHSLNSSKSELMIRMFCSDNKIDMHALYTGRLPKSMAEKVALATSKWEDEGLYINDSTCSILDICAKARKLKLEHGLDFLVIDYLQLINEERGDSKIKMVTYIMRTLKMLAKELDIPILLLSQLSAKLERRADKRPMLSDFLQSLVIDKFADAVLFIYREVVYNIEADPDGAEIVIAKNRGGAVGIVNLNFVSEYALFEDYKLGTNRFEF